MSAIERCRTAALGGHVGRCEKCATPSSPTTAAATGTVPSARALPHASGWPNARPISCRCRTFMCVHTAGADRRHRLSEQGGDLRPAVQSFGRDHAHDRGRSQASRRTHRLHVGAPHLGSALTHHRMCTWWCRRRLVAGRIEVDRVPPALLPDRGGSLRLFRRLLLEMLVAAHDAGCLQFFGTHARLADKAAFAAYLRPLRQIDWVVYAKERSPGQDRCCTICRATPTASRSPIEG